MTVFHSSSVCFNSEIPSLSVKKGPFSFKSFPHYFIESIEVSVPYNTSFVDKACSVKMAGYWPRSFFFLRVYGPLFLLGPEIRPLNADLVTARSISQLKMSVRFRLNRNLKTMWRTGEEASAL